MRPGAAWRSLAFTFRDSGGSVVGVQQLWPLYKQAGNRLGEAKQARAAYDEARTLYKQVDHHLGEANVLRGLGNLERKLGRKKRARAAFDEAAQLFQAIGMVNERDDALRHALLYCPSTHKPN